MRIACEATTNAARHGQPRQIDVVLEQHGPSVLTVRDDGSGFDPERVDGRGFGLRTMEARARAIGAELRIRSAPGEGTVVEVRWT